MAGFYGRPEKMAPAKLEWHARYCGAAIVPMVLKELTDEAYRIFSVTPADGIGLASNFWIIAYRNIAYAKKFAPKKAKKAKAKPVENLTD